MIYTKHVGGWMKVLILGYDALEYTLVERLDLKNLKQREYGKVSVPITNPLGDPSTPVVWSSFITGKLPTEHGITVPIEWKNNFIRRTAKWLQQHKYLYFLTSELKIGSLLDKTGFKHQMSSSKSLSVPTFFDAINKSVAVCVPVYNKDVFRVYPGDELERAISDRMYRRKYEAKVRKIFEYEKERFFKEIGDEWKLLMVHFHISDILGHVYWNTPKKLIELYRELDSLTGFIKHKVSEDVWILIISDHGMKKGLHTPYGFYSSDRLMRLSNPSITDFYDLILKHVEN